MAWHSADPEPYVPEQGREIKPKPYMAEALDHILYLYHQHYPKAPRKRRYLCGCGYTIFRANFDTIVISTDIGVPWKEYEPGANLIETQCPNCKSKFTILFQ